MDNWRRVQCSYNMASEMTVPVEKVATIEDKELTVDNMFQLEDAVGLVLKNCSSPEWKKVGQLIA